MGMDTNYRERIGIEILLSRVQPGLRRLKQKEGPQTRVRTGKGKFREGKESIPIAKGRKRD